MELSIIEKELLKNLINHKNMESENGVSFADLLLTLKSFKSNNFVLIFNPPEKAIYIHFIDLNKKFFKCRNLIALEIFQVITLLETLILNRKLYFWGEDSNEGAALPSNNIVLNLKLTVKDYEKSLIKLPEILSQNFYNKSQFRISVSTELKTFVENNFKSKSDLQYEKNIKITWIAIWASIIIGLISTFIGILSIWYSAQSSPNTPYNIINYIINNYSL